MKTFSSWLLLFGVANSVAAQAACPASTVLPELDAAYHACPHYAGESCHKFISEFKKLAGRYDCKRSFDTGPVPAIWLAGEGALDDYVQLMWKIATEEKFKNKFYRGADSEARTFFASKEFQGVLDGALAEEYLERSRTMSAAMGKLESEPN